MNERIQKLADHAEDYADEKVDQGGEFHPHYTQKLTELILTEVISTIYRSDIGDRRQERLVDELAYKFGLKP
jgi:hypothetical protein